jgi:hypothetical protein
MTIPTTTKTNNKKKNDINWMMVKCSSTAQRLQAFLTPCRVFRISQALFSSSFSYDLDIIVIKSNPGVNLSQGIGF